MKREVVTVTLFVFIGLLCIFVAKWAELTGNAVHNPYTPTDCSEAELKKIWEDIFIESSNGINVTTDGNACDNFQLYKNKSNETFYIVGGRLSFFSDIRMVLAGHVNGTTTVSPDVLSDQEEMMNVAQGRSVTSPAQARVIFETIFKNSGNDWVFVKNNSDSNYDQYVLNESFENSTMVENMIGSVLANKSYELWTYISIDMSEIAFNKIANVSELEFAENSEWNNAFNIHSIFLGGENFSCVYLNNSEFVNCTIENDGDVLFRPKENFTGKVFFKIKAEKTGFDPLESNVFSVLIEEHNVAPRYLGGLGSLVVPRSNYSLRKSMGLYFADEDGDSLTYRVSGNLNSSISFEGEDIVVGWDSNYESLEKVKVYASDGKVETSSNEFYIGLEEKGDENNATDIETLAASSTTGAAETTNGSGKQISEKSNIFFWIIVVLVGIVVFILLVLLVYFVFIKKEPIKEADEGSKKVEEYLQQLSDS